MPFSIGELARVSSSGNTSAPAAWNYSSAVDAAAVIVASGYFDSVANNLRVGDAFFIYDSAGVATLSFVKTIAAGVVDLASGTAIGDV